MFKIIIKSNRTPESQSHTVPTDELIDDSCSVAPCLKKHNVAISVAESGNVDVDDS